MLYVWRIDFEFLLEDHEAWEKQTAFHVGDEDGSRSVSFVETAIIGSEVKIEVKASPTTEPYVAHSKKVRAFRLVGLIQICKLDFIDFDALESHGLLEKQGEVHILPPCINPGPQ